VNTLLEPTADLPDDISLERVRLPTRIRNVLLSAGVRTIGEIREATDATLVSFPNMGSRIRPNGSVITCRSPRHRRDMLSQTTTRSPQAELVEGPSAFRDARKDRPGK
jgi:hypothetical protein